MLSSCSVATRITLMSRLRMSSSIVSFGATTVSMMSAEGLVARVAKKGRVKRHLRALNRLKEECEFRELKLKKELRAKYVRQPARKQTLQRKISREQEIKKALQRQQEILTPPLADRRLGAPSIEFYDHGPSTQDAMEDPLPFVDIPPPKDNLYPSTSAHGKGLSCLLCPMCEDFPSPSGQKIFIGHTRQDTIGQSVAGHLADNLVRMGYHTFYDVWSLKGGDDWMQCIEQCVRSSLIFVCLLSKSFWFRYVCMHELDIALRSNRVIIPVCVDGNPPNEGDQYFRDRFYAEHTNNQNGYPIDKQLLDQWLRNIRELRKFNRVYHYPGPKDSEVHLKWMITCAIRNKIHGDGGIGFHDDPR